MDGEMTPELDLPGFRFHPTEEELLGFYLKNLAFGKKIRCEVIGFLNIYHHDPWDLPGLAKIGEREWYFFVPRDRKHGAGGRPNRTTEKGFWKATGSDRRIVSLSEPKRIIGLRKTLVFYRGRAPRGSKTDWVMNEYRLPDTCSSPKDIVLCKIYRKATSLKVLEQRAAMEEEMKTTMMQHTSPSSPLIMSSASSASSSSSMDINTMISFNGQQQQQELIMVGPAPLTMPLNQQEDTGFKKEKQEMVEEEAKKKSNKGMVMVPCSSSAIKFPKGQDILAELQVTKSMDWTQDPFWNQLNSPWLQNLSPYANILNFY